MLCATWICTSCCHDDAEAGLSTEAPPSLGPAWNTQKYKCGIDYLKFEVHNYLKFITPSYLKSEIHSYMKFAVLSHLKYKAQSYMKWKHEAHSTMEVIFRTKQNPSNHTTKSNAVFVIHISLWWKRTGGKEVEWTCNTHVRNAEFLTSRTRL